MQNFRHYLQPGAWFSHRTLSGLLILFCVLVATGLLHPRLSNHTRPSLVVPASGSASAPSPQPAVLVPSTSTPDTGAQAVVQPRISPTAVPTLQNAASGAPAPAKTATPARAGTSVGATTDDYVNVHTGPDTSYPIVAQLPADVRAQILDTGANWYHILTLWDTQGWVSGDYFKRVAEQASGPQPRVLGSAATVGVVNLRDGPGTGYRSLGMLSDGTVLEVLELQSDWYKVRSPRGTIGWVASEYAPLDWIPDIYGGSSPPAAAASSAIVQIAQKYLGARYIWGGSYPSGFDCSGLTWYVYQKVGVSLPAGSAQQYSRQYGRYIGDMSALAPGDLVFFERTTEEAGITHIGIYAGGGKMIAARSERLGVRYVSLLEPFWSSRFVGGIRPYR